MQTTDKLTEIISSTGLDKTKSSVLLENFSDYFQIASEWESKAKKIVVNDSTQVEEMQKAREGRLFLKQKRVAIEKTRVVLKQNSLREGQAIDSIAKMLTSLITPIESDLELKEKFKELEEKKIKDDLRTARQLLVSDYMKYIPLNVDLADYTEVAFNTILKGAKLEYEAEQENIKKEKEEEEKKQKVNQLHTERRELIINKGFWQYIDVQFTTMNLGTLTDKYFDSLLIDLSNRKRNAEEEIQKIKEQNEQLKKKQEELIAQIEKNEPEQNVSEPNKASSKKQLIQWVESFDLPEVNTTKNRHAQIVSDIQMKFELFKKWSLSQVDRIK